MKNDWFPYTVAAAAAIAVAVGLFWSLVWQMNAARIRALSINCFRLKVYSCSASQCKSAAANLFAS